MTEYTLLLNRHNALRQKAIDLLGSHGADSEECRACIAEAQHISEMLKSMDASVGAYHGNDRYDGTGSDANIQGMKKPIKLSDIIDLESLNIEVNELRDMLTAAADGQYWKERCLAAEAFIETYYLSPELCLAEEERRFAEWEKIKAKEPKNEIDPETGTIRQ